MNKEIHTTTLPEGVVSESAVRDALRSRPQTIQASDAQHHRSTESLAVAAEAPLRPSRVQPVRRWSVAELLAGAVRRPPIRGVARGSLGNPTVSIPS